MKLNNFISKILYFFILVLIIIFSFYFFFSNSVFSQKIKSIVPLEFKLLVKNTVFYFPNLIKENQSLKNENIKLYSDISKLENLTNSSNKKFFPTTQYLKLNYVENPVDLKAKITYERYGEYVKPFYIDVYKNYLVLINKENKIFYEKIDNLKNNNFKLKQINSNLPAGEILDILIDKNKIFVSISKIQDDNCLHDKFSIYRAKINLDNLNFSEIFRPIGNNEIDIYCDSKYGPIGGALAYNKDKNEIVFSATNLDTEYRNFKSKELNENFLKTNKFASILSHNIDTSETKTLSIGHRNPLGLLINKEGVLLSTEHGPRGGDEINKIIEGKNYGWPIVSAGEPYVTKPNDIYFYKKNHSEQGFEEPIYSFVPSIGISRIINIEDNFSEKWKNNYFVTSLRKRSLYRVEFDNEFTKVKSIEEIYVGKRIRDIAYSKNKKIFFLALEDNESNLGMLFK